VGADVDVVVLGCTHYPLFRDLIEREAARMLGAHVRIIDSAHATATELGTLLRERDLAAPHGHTRADSEELSAVELLVTDLPRAFADTTARFLGGSPREVRVIDL
jgi:glutamate racemase